LPQAKALIQKVAVVSASASVKEIGTQLLNPLSGQIAAGYGEDLRKQLERGQQIFMGLCFACHGVDGKGTPLEGSVGATLAPPLAGSATVLGHRDAIINVLLFGVAGPIGHASYEAQMASMGANDDDWMAAVASYVRTGFGNKGSVVPTKDVARIRAENLGRKDAWTLAELQQRLPQPLDNGKEWRLTTNHRVKEDAVQPARKIILSFNAGPDQEPGTWLQVELPHTELLSDLRLGCIKAPRNYPRGYRVELSSDGSTWSKPVASGKGNGPIIEISFNPTSARFIRITQTERATNTPWTVDDLVLFRAAVTPSRGSKDVITDGRAELSAGSQSKTL